MIMMQIDAPGMEGQDTQPTGLPATDQPLTAEIVTIRKEFAMERGDLVSHVRALEVVDQATHDEMAGYQLAAAMLEKKIMEKYHRMWKTTKDAYDTVLAERRADLDPVLEVKRIASTRNAAFEVKQEQARQQAQREAEEKARKEAEAERQRELAQARKEGATKKELKEIEKAPLEVQAPAIEPTYEKAKGVSKPIAHYKAVETDGDKGLMELAKAVVAGKREVRAIERNMNFLNQQARALKELFDYPGVKLDVSYTTSTRAGSFSRRS